MNNNNKERREEEEEKPWRRGEAGIQKASPRSNLLVPEKKDMFISILTIQIADQLCTFVIFDSCSIGCHSNFVTRKTLIAL